MAVGATKAVWVHLLKEGGRWSVAEIRAALPGYSLHSVEVAIGRMATLGLVKRFEKDRLHERVTFGVTALCKIPQGVLLQELAALGIIKEAA